MSEMEKGKERGASFARGGPVFLQKNFIGPITSVPEFQSAITHRLLSLRSELPYDSNHEQLDLDQELDVDELRVLSDEELVHRAFKEAFENAEENENLSEFMEDCSNDINKSNCVEHNESTGGANLEGQSSCCLDNVDQNSSKKGKKRRRTSGKDYCSSELQCCYIDKVEELAKIKQKQDLDRATIQLHSLSCNTKMTEAAISVKEECERMKSVRLASTMKAKPSTGHGVLPLHNSEVVLSIEVYNWKSTQKKQEFLVLGSQTLTALRDNIHCITDHLMQKEGKHNPSGYFLIEDIFFNDLRDPVALDYSRPIFEWLSTCKKDALDKWQHITLSEKNTAVLGSEPITNLPQFKTVHMHKVRFCDLRFRLGSGYLYCHQGDCKHIIVIKDMRLIHPEDEQSMNAYPILAFQIYPRVPKCSVCRTFRPLKVTVDDKWAEDNPCHFCKACYFLLHHTVDESERESGSSLNKCNLLYDTFTCYDYHHEFYAKND